MNNSIDLNCDLGEGFAHDAELMPLITSANIACGAHAGSREIIAATIALARQHNVQVGAHPGYADRDHFGRVELDLTASEIVDLVAHQIELLYSCCREGRVVLRHVKPHGALYNQAARSAWIADAIAEAVAQVDPRLILVGLAGSELISAGQRRGLPTAAEIFADRRYESDGTLTPRTKANAVLQTREEIRDQLQRLLAHGIGQTICLHGDTPDAPRLAGDIREVLAELKMTIEPMRSVVR